MRQGKKLFGFEVSRAQHALLHAAARAKGADSASAWARRVLLSAAREEFRGALREAMEPTPERAEAERVPA